MAKLIICDFDGTMYRKGEEREFQKQLSLIRSSDAFFAVASGRPWHMLRPYFESVSDRVFLISDDGALLTQGERILHSAPIDRERLISYLAAFDGDWIAYGALTSYLKLHSVGDTILWRRRFRQHAMKVDHINEIDEPIYKIFFLQPRECPEFLTPTYRNRFGLTEFSAVGTEKSNAAKVLCDLLGISPGDCVAFGDGSNDLPLFSFAGTSYAMAGAPPAVKDRADHRCDLLSRTLEALLTDRSESANSTERSGHFGTVITG